MSHAAVFKGIYSSGAWGPPGYSSGSGSLPQFAAPYIAFIERYVRRHDIGRVLDLGCGNLQLARAIDWGCASWTGIDVVAAPGVIDGDMRTCPWPAADLVLVKDVLQHWPAADIQALRPRLAGYPHVLITNSASGLSTNSDIEAGQVRSLDLSQPPFCWPVREVLRWQGDEIKSCVSLRQGG